MATDTLSPTELRNLLVTMTAGATGSEEEGWYDRLGLVETLPIPEVLPNIAPLDSIKMTDTTGLRSTLETRAPVEREICPVIYRL